MNLLTDDGLEFLLELNGLRNRFAHRLGYELSEEDVQRLGDLCSDVDAIVDSEDNLETRFSKISKIFSRLAGRIVGEFLGGRITVEESAD